MSFEVFHPDNEFVKSEKAEYKKWEEARGELVGGDTPDKKLEWDKDKNKETTEDKQKVTYNHKPDLQEIQQAAHEKVEATNLINWTDDGTWPPPSIESHVGWTEWWRRAEAQLV